MNAFDKQMKESTKKNYTGTSLESKPELTKDDKNRLELCILDRIEFFASIRKRTNTKSLTYIAAQKEIETLRELLYKACE